MTSRTPLFIINFKKILYGFIFTIQSSVFSNNKSSPYEKGSR